MNDRKTYLAALMAVTVGAIATVCGAEPPHDDPTPRSPAAAAPAEVPVAKPRDVPTFVWAIEEVDAGIRPALALRSDDVPFIVYTRQGALPWERQSSKEGAVKNAVRNGIAWDVTTIAVGKVYGPMDMTMGPDDMAHVSYFHDRNRAGSSALAYAVLIGGRWDTDAAFDSSDSGWDYRIAIGPSGQPHMSATNAWGGLKGLSYLASDRRGNWVTEGIDSGPIKWEDTTSIAIDLLGNPHVSYLDVAVKNLSLASRSEAGWNVDIVDDESGSGLFSALLIDDVGRFHIGYLQRASTSTPGVVKYATIGLDDSQWEIRQVGTLDDLSLIWPGPRRFTSVALGPDHQPWIAYSDEKVLNIAVWDGSSWQTQTVVKAGDETFGQHVFLKLDSNGHPHLAYFEVTSREPLTGVVKYAKGTPQ